MLCSRCFLSEEAAESMEPYLPMLQLHMADLVLVSKLIWSVVGGTSELHVFVELLKITEC